MMHIEDFYANAIAEMEAASAPRKISAVVRS